MGFGWGEPADEVAEGLEGQAGVSQGAVGNGAVGQPGVGGGLAQGEGRYGLAGDQRPAVVEGGEVDDVVVEGVGDPAAAEAPLQELDVHAHVLAGRNDLDAPGEHRDQLLECLAERDAVLLPLLGVVAEDLGGLVGDALGSRLHLPVLLPELGKPVVGHDHPDLGDVVKLGVEASKLAVQEHEGEFGQAASVLRGFAAAEVALPTGVEPVFQP